MRNDAVHFLAGAKKIHRKALRKEDCHIQFLDIHPPMKLNGVWWKEVDRTSGSHRLPAPANAFIAAYKVMRHCIHTLGLHARRTCPSSFPTRCAALPDAEIAICC